GQREEAAALGQDRDHPLAVRRNVSARVGARLLQHVRNPDDERVRRELRQHPLPRVLRAAAEITTLHKNWYLGLGPWSVLSAWSVLGPSSLVFPPSAQPQTTAYTRHGPPDAVSCFGPPTMIVAPAGGTASRLAISSTAYFPAPSSARCATNF